MTSYTIAAIPTVYNGRRYRSRLEAKWAAFFTLLNWRFEYEPFDLGGWSPDFLLRGKNDAQVFAEVKPIEVWDQDVATKMEKAAIRSGVMHKADGLLLLGTSPFRQDVGLMLGWLSSVRQDARVSWRGTALTWQPDAGTPVFHSDFLSLDVRDGEAIGWKAVLTGARGDGFPSHFASYNEHSLELWAQATNAVQWLPKGGRS